MGKTTVIKAYWDCKYCDKEYTKHKELRYCDYTYDYTNANIIV